MPDSVPAVVPPPDEAKAWHLDRKVPVALILAMASQLALGVWWMSGMSSRVAHLESRIPALEQSDATNVVEMRRISEQLARMDERIIALTALLQSAIQRLPRARVQGIE